MSHIALLRLKSFLGSPASYLRAWWKLWREKDVHGWRSFTNWNPHWNERTRMMAAMVPPHSSVLEFGSAMEYLATCLPEGCSYQPSDIAQRTPRTLVCDLNESFPHFEKKWDVIVLSGVTEYMIDLAGLLKKLRANCERCIISYAPVDRLECITTRMQNSWVNHFTKAQFEAMIADASFTIEQHKNWSNQDIYSLR